MKIVALEAENVKHLKVVNIKPDGSLVVIGGDNAQGKTCVLDSIEYALGGAGSIPSQPIRKGEKKARVVLDLGEIEVTRTFTPGGTKVVVKSKDGATFASPQAMLDKLVGELTFDPLEFSKMGVKEQAEVLRQLVGVDFTAIDNEHKTVFDERTVVNRKGKELVAKLKGMKKHDNIPDKPVCVTELIGKIQKANEDNRSIQAIRDSLSSDEERLANLTAELDRLKISIRKKKSSLEGKELVDTTAIEEQARCAETINTKISENKRYDELDKEVDELRSQSAAMSKRLVELQESKKDMLNNAEFPVDGLSVDSDGVTFNGIPFDQCSTAQRIRVSVAMGLAMNPELRVLLIREGSLLDEQNLAMIAEMADDFDAQVWMERVSKGDECQVIIEDGSVKE